MNEVPTRFTGVVEQDGAVWIAHCEELGTSTFGNSVKEAFAMLGDAIEVHLAALAQLKEET